MAKDRMRRQARGEEGSAARITAYRVAGVWGWSLFLGLQRMAALTAPDIVHIQYQTAAYRMHPGVNVTPFLLRFISSVPIAVTYHDTLVPYLFPKAGGLRKKVTMLPAGYSDLTIATNPEDRQAISDNARPARLATVPIGSNIPDDPPPDYDRREWRLAAGVQDGQALIGYFGMLNASKGALRLVETLSRLKSEGRSPRLAMIGSSVGASDPTNADYLEAVEAGFAAEGVSDSVVWTGHLPATDVSAWLRACDVLALPYEDGASFRRGSLLAALTHGCAVVTTEPASSAERAAADFPALNDGDSALLVPTGDAHALTDGIRAVLDNPDLAQNLSEGARVLAGRFGWDEIARQHEDLYRNLIGTPEMLMPDL
jgi:glycosyltransferase involved in cell wall biosynthesis